MPRDIPSRRAPRHHLMIHRRPPRRDRFRTASGAVPVKLSDLILGLLALTLLGGLGLLAAASVMARAVAP